MEASGLAGNVGPPGLCLRPAQRGPSLPSLGLAGLELVGGSPTTGLAGIGLLEELTDELLRRDKDWERHVIEVDTERPPGADATAPLREEYDPSERTVRQREAAKAAELSSAGRPPSPVTAVHRQSTKGTGLRSEPQTPFFGLGASTPPFAPAASPRSRACAGRDQQRLLLGPPRSDPRGVRTSAGPHIRFPYAGVYVVPKTPDSLASGPNRSYLIADDSRGHLLEDSIRRSGGYNRLGITGGLSARRLRATKIFGRLPT
jgi:hypothetical protein